MVATTTKKIVEWLTITMAAALFVSAALIKNLVGGITNKKITLSNERSLSLQPKKTALTEKSFSGKIWFAGKLKK